MNSAQRIAEQELHSQPDEERDRQLQVEHDQRTVKTLLLNTASELAGTLYFLTQRYSRQKSNNSAWGAPDGPQLDTAYIEWATKAESFERELEARYGWDTRPVTLWHQARDLLTVRYFDLRENNFFHCEKVTPVAATDCTSGLSCEELTDMQLVVTTYRATSKELAKALLDGSVNI